MPANNSAINVCQWCARHTMLGAGGLAVSWAPRDRCSQPSRILHPSHRQVNKWMKEYLRASLGIFLDVGSLGWSFLEVWKWNLTTLLISSLDSLLLFPPSERKQKLWCFPGWLLAFGTSWSRMTVAVVLEKQKRVWNGYCQEHFQLYFSWSW